jgi:hypothetical protein
MHLRKLSMIGLSAAASICCSFAQAGAVPDSGIEGVILLSPTPPRMARGEAAEPPAPLANAPFVVIKEMGEAIAYFNTNAQGRFRIATPPGHYRVLQQDNKGRVRRCGSWDVEVAAGQITTVEWYCDVGGAPLRYGTAR